MRYRFDDFELDCDRFELRRNGEALSAEPQVLDLLILLAKSGGRLVSKDEIVEEVWSGRIVSDAAITSRVKSARRLLGDDGSRQMMIRTIWRKGVRFVPKVEMLDGSPSENATPESSKHGATKSPADERGHWSGPLIAVLPFSASPQTDEYIAEGITDDTIGALSRFRELQILARNTVYAMQNVAEADAITSLGANYIVRGHVQLTKGLMRVTAELVETENGRQVWSERFVGADAELVDLQENLARSIAAALEPELTRVELCRSRTKSHPELTAWELYQQGKAEWYRDTKESNELALEYFHRAVQAAPNFAAPKALAAYVIFNQLVSGYRPQSDTAIDEAISLAQRALQLDSRDAWAHLAIGRLSLLRCKHDDSLAALRNAVALNPSCADAHHALGFTLIFCGEPQAALPHFDQALRLSPFDPRISTFHEMRAWSLLVSGRTDEAIAAARAAVRSPNAQHWAYATLCAALALGGHADEAQQVASQLLKMKPEFSIKFVREVVYYCRSQEQLELYVDGLRAGGIPEQSI